MDFFPQEEADIIGEISNISIGSSATAMNLMLGQRVSITAPKVSIVKKEEIFQDYSNSCVIIKVQYTQGLYGNNILVLREEDVKIITDLMMGNDGKGCYTQGEISDFHLSAVAEAMNQMTANSATAMSKVFDSKVDISPPKVEHVQIKNYQYDDGFLDDTFVKINYDMKIGSLIDSTIMQLYPFDLAHSIYKLFQRRK